MSLSRNTLGAVLFLAAPRYRLKSALVLALCVYIVCAHPYLAAAYLIFRIIRYFTS